ncbi:MAG: hypothetical protein IKM28_10440 [Lachnospiraceae bacterium]|nr:hypothetical protein [Lachnospiraceae bacterium]
MIDPVSNRGYYEYEYGKINTQMGTSTDNGEKFALNQDGMEKEGSQKKKDKKVGEAEGVVVELSGQSGGAYTKSKDAKTTEKEASDSQDVNQILSGIGHLFSNLTKWISGFFSGIKQAVSDFWNSDSASAESEAELQEATNESTEESVEAEIVTDEEIAEAGKMDEEAAEPDGVVADVTEDAIISDEATGKMVPVLSAYRKAELERIDEIQDYLDNVDQVKYVRNSDLLTYYDRRGKIVQLNGSDKNRILHGEKSAERFRR